jgi:nicotinamidase-related amidase
MTDTSTPTDANQVVAPPRFVAGTEPYPWPWDGDLRPERLALVITGTQRIHIDASIDARTVAERIVTLAGVVRRAGGIVCHVRHTAAGDRARPLLPRIGDEGWAPALKTEPGDLMVEAHGHDGFHDSGLDLMLRSRGVELLAVVGMTAEVTVSSTVRSANDRGYECLTLIDASAPIEEFTGARHLHSVTMSGGIFGAIGDSDALIAALHDSPEPAEPT